MRIESSDNFPEETMLNSTVEFSDEKNHNISDIHVMDWSDDTQMFMQNIENKDSIIKKPITTLAITCDKNLQEEADVIEKHNNSIFEESMNIFENFENTFDTTALNIAECKIKSVTKISDDELYKSTKHKNVANHEEMDSLLNQFDCSLFEISQNETDLNKCPTESNHKDNVQEVTEVAKDNCKMPDYLSGNVFDNSFSCLVEDFNINNTLEMGLLENASKIVKDKTDNISTVIPTECKIKKLGSFFGLPEKVKELMNQYKGITNLYKWQEECLNLPTVLARKNLVYALPTSGGKTLVAEILMLREILCRNLNVIFILPYVSIVQEKIWALSPFAVALEFLIEEYAAGRGNYPPRKRRRKNSIYIATIEKALGLINSLIETNRIHEVGLVVVDELHLIGDRSRGATLEALLTKLIYIEKDIQIIGMSATIGNLSEICEFLKADVYTQNFRPVDLIEYVKCGDEISKINWSAKNGDQFLIHDRNTNFPYTESLTKIDPDMLAGLVLEIIPKESCLIFCPSKKGCENVAYLLCKIIFPTLKEYKTIEKAALIKALTDESSVLCNILKVSIPFGVAYHHSGLTSEERKLIEDGFRNGILSVICCTSTLAAGVNLPAKRVIIRQPYIGRDFMNLSRYKQMVGRAGRAGFGEKGESIIICTSKELPKLKQMLMAPMDLAQSSMQDCDKRGLEQFILSCLNLGLATTRLELQNIVNHTLMAIQQDILEINIKKAIDNVIINLFKLGALKTTTIKTDIEEDESVINDITNVNFSPALSRHSKNENRSKSKTAINNETILSISKLGRAAIKAGLDLSKAHMLYEDLEQAQASLVLLDCLHLLYLVTPYDMAEQIVPSKSLYYEIYNGLSKKELQTANVLGINDSCAIKLVTNVPIKSVSERILNRFYVTLMLYELWNEIPLYKVSEKYQVERGQIQNLMTSAASFASSVVRFCEELEEFWPFTHLLKGMNERLSHCCVREIAPLMELPAVKQNRAKQLYNAGFKTLQSIAKAKPDDMITNVEYMSVKLANQLIAAAKMLLIEKVENLREQAEDVLDGI